MNPHLPLLWSALLLAPNLAFVAVADDALDAALRSLPPAIALLVALHGWLRRPAWVLGLLIPFFFLLPFETYYVLRYGQPSTPHVLGVVFETNWREASEFFGGPLLVAGIVLGLALVAMTLWLARRAPPLPEHRLVRPLAVLATLPLMLYAWLEWDWLDRRKVFDAYAAQTAIEQLHKPAFATPTGALLSDAYPLGTVFRVRDYLAERARVRAAAAQILADDYQPTRASTAPGPEAPEVYVLVIGESARPDHWGLNGYARPTTPELAKIPGVVGLRNVVTPWPGTRVAVPVILTGAVDARHEAPLGRASIVGLFKQAGFATYWISNQAPLGDHDSLITLYAQEADEAIFVNAGDYTQDSAHDDALLPPFERLLAGAPKKKFFVLHMLGSHKRYDKRYPAAFDLFKPSLKDGGAPTDEKVANSYDNSILFTDHVLSRVINALAKAAPHAALLYVSDHGQNLPSETCPASGHGTKYEADYLVAALLWGSPALQATQAALWQRARERRDAPLYTTGAFHALAEIAAIDYPRYDARASWVASEWQPAPRWTSPVPDFDRALRVPPCKKLMMPRSS